MNFLLFTTILLLSASPLAPARAQPAPLRCGDTLRASAVLLGDLHCPGYRGFPLRLIGAGLTLDGNGHRIHAPDALAGLYVEGPGITVQNLKVHGVTGGPGILAYEAPGVVVRGNDVSGNQTGVYLYADRAPLEGARIHANLARGNSAFGIRTGSARTGVIISPHIHNNVLWNSGDYALHVEAASFSLGPDHGNSLTGSANGIHLSGGSMQLRGLRLAAERLEGTAIRAMRPAELVAEDLELGSAHPGLRAPQIGIDLEGVSLFRLHGVRTGGGELGVRVSTRGTVRSAGTISGSEFGAHSYAAVVLASEADAPFGRLLIEENCFRGQDPAKSIRLQGAVSFAPGSVVENGGSCEPASGAGGDRILSRR